MPQRFEMPPDRLAARLCAAGALLMLLVLLASAALRLGGAACDVPALSAGIVTAARALHRIAASLVGVLLLAIIVLALRRRPLARATVLPLGGAAAATVFLALLGRASAGSVTPLVIIGNVVAGVVLYVLLRHLQRQFEPLPAPHFSARRLRGAAVAARAAAGIQVWLGAWAAGMAAQFACAATPAADGWWTGLPDLAAFDPLRAMGGNDAAALYWVQALHTASALAVLLLAVPLALRMHGLGGDVRRAAQRLIVVLGLQAALGGMLALAVVPAWTGAAHTALAAILLGMLVRTAGDLHRA